MNAVFCIMIAAAFGYAAIGGNLDAVTHAAVQAGGDALQTVLGLLGGFMLFGGVMKLLEEAGAVRALVRWLKRPLRWVFGSQAGEDALGATALNLSANMLGIAHGAARSKAIAARWADCRQRTAVHAAGDQCNLRAAVPILGDCDALCGGQRRAGNHRPAYACCQHVGHGGGHGSVLAVRKEAPPMTAWLLAIAMVIAMIRRVEVYTAFTAGAREGMETAMRILPGLAAIFVALRMLEASGLMHALCGALAPVAAWLGLPEGVMPLLLLRPLSGSASLGMLADILRQYGPDSRTGLVASAMMGSGETVLYTCALYLAAAGVKKSRYIIPASLLGWIVDCAVAGCFFRA